MTTYTAKQMRLLHRLAAARGLTHEDLRAVAGVTQSLTELDRDRMAHLIDHLVADKPEPRRRRRPPPGVIRPATDRQRHAIASLLDATGWTAALAAGWLRDRHAIRDVAAGAYSTRTASHAITELQNVVDKATRQRGNEMKTGTRVKLQDNGMTRAWGYAGYVGTVIGPDPRGTDPEVVRVKLDSGSSVFEVKGINVGHLDTLTETHAATKGLNPNPEP